MSYFGVPPTDGEKIDEPLLQPGWHEVSVERTERVKTKKGDRILVTLGNERGVVKEWLPAALEGEKTAWKFWRLVGALGYPSNDYWDGPKDRQWDIVRDLSDAKRLGMTFLVELEMTQYGPDPSIKEAVNPERHPERLPNGLAQVYGASSATPEERREAIEKIRSSFDSADIGGAFGEEVPF